MGKRNIETAIRSTPHDVTVRWKPFFLRPDMPMEGKDKGGTPETRVPARLKQVGASVGIDFSGLTDRYPNTTAAHALLSWAEETAGPQKQNELAEITFRHYFTDGLYPNVENLVAAAAEAGLDGEAARVAVTSNVRLEAVKLEANKYRGCGGVPFFVVNGEPVFSGAQPPNVFESIFEDA